MKTLIIILLAFLCAMAACNAEKSCRSPKKWNRFTRSCQCPVSRNLYDCINWEDFDEDSCNCFCPLPKHYKKCPKDREWSYRNCYCLRKTKELSKTVTTPQPTLSFTTQTCSYGWKVYDKHKKIDDGVSFDVNGKNTYVAYSTINGLIIPGGLNVNNPVLRGFYCSHKGKGYHGIHNNVMYLTQSPDCNCHFISHNEAIPPNGFLLTLNSKPNEFGIGTTNYHNSTSNIIFTVFGKIDIATNTLSYFSPLDNAEKTTEYFTKLVCVPAEVTSSTPTTETTIPLNPNDAFNQKIDVSNAILDQLNKNESKALELNTTLVNRLQDLASDPIIPSNDISIFKNCIGILCTESNKVSNYTIREKKKHISCKYANTTIDSLEATLNASSAFLGGFTAMGGKLFTEISGAGNLPPDTGDIFASITGAFGQVISLQANLEDILNDIRTIRDLICHIPTTTTSTTTETPTEI